MDIPSSNTGRLVARLLLDLNSDKAQREVKCRATYRHAGRCRTAATCMPISYAFESFACMLQVRMREMEKAMRQMEKDESRQLRGLTGSSGRTDFGRTTLSGRGSPTGSTPTASGLTTPTGRLTPPGISTGGEAADRVTPPSTTGSGRSTPTGKVTPPGTTSPGRTAPVLNTAHHLDAVDSDPQRFAMADAAGTTTVSGRGISGLTSPADSVTPSDVSFSTADQADFHSSFLHESPSAEDAAKGFFADSNEVDSAAVASGHQQGADNSLNLDSFATAGSRLTTAAAPAASQPGQLLPTKSSVKDAVATWEVSHPASSRLAPGRSTAAQPATGLSSSVYEASHDSMSSPLAASRSSAAQQASSLSRGVSSSLSRGVSSKIASSKSSVAYQTKSLSEGVYGKLYSSRSSAAQIVTSPSWDREEEEQLITTERLAVKNGGMVSSGISTSSSGGGTAVRADATSSSGIGRFGGGVGRGGVKKFAVEVRPAAGYAAMTSQTAELTEAPDR